MISPLNLYIVFLAMCLLVKYIFLCTLFWCLISSFKKMQGVFFVFICNVMEVATDNFFHIFHDVQLNDYQKRKNVHIVTYSQVRKE